MPYLCSRACKMKKKVILLSIILFPSLIYLFFEMTKANFKKMAYFGPKTLNEKGDTIYYRVPGVYFYDHLGFSEETKADPEGNQITAKIQHADSSLIDTSAFPIYVILFTEPKFKHEGYKLNGIYDFMKYKLKELKDIPVFVVSDFDSAAKGHKEKVELRGEFDSLKISIPGFHSLLLKCKDRRVFLAGTYFKQKPFYVMDHFMVLIDKQRHIRGYYDPSFNAEITRMIADYKHLKIRDGYAQTQKQNDIKQNDNK
jgi:hypothetical protein